MSVKTYSVIPEVNAACMRSTAEGHTLTRDMVFILETVFKSNLTYENVTEIFSAAVEYRAEKEKLIESISADVAGQLAEREHIGISGTDLESLAYAVNDRIGDPNLRSLHILTAV